MEGAYVLVPIGFIVSIVVAIIFVIFDNYNAFINEISIVWLPFTIIFLGTACVAVFNALKTGMEDGFGK